MRRAPLALWLLLAATLPAPALAQLSINFSLPGGEIGLNLGGFPTLQRVPGYPVYYAPGVNSNYFFYDGLYWIYQRDNWYASSWYNGPWALVDPMDVPDYLLRVPVRYYSHAPVYFRGWNSNDAPRWGEHWGNSWQQRRSGWDQWNRKSSPAPAPLPTYQRRYTGNKYPQASQQAVLESRNYRYQPQDRVAQQRFQQQRSQAQQAPQRQQQQARPQTQQQAPAPQRKPPAPQQQQRQQQQQQQQREQQQQQQHAAPAQRQQAPRPTREAQPNAIARPQAAPKPEQPAQRNAKPQAAPKAPQAQRPQPAERAPQPAAREQQARPQAPARAPQANEQGKDRGNERDKGNERGKGNEGGNGKGQDNNKQEDHGSGG